MSSQTLRIKLKQVQQLSQNMQQSLRILQMSGLEIEREVAEWLAENPLLEHKELPENSNTELITAKLSQKEVSLNDETNENIWENISSEETLNSYLHKQVCEYPLSEQEAAHIHILIDFLDDQGYLTESLEEIVEHTPLEWMLTEEDLEIALEHLRQFDPAGVATANLSQSLLYQLDRLPFSDIRTCASKIVAQHLDQISQNTIKSVNRLGRLLPEFKEPQLRAALEMIAKLSPYPAYGFSNNTPISYIRPDIIVQPSQNGWQITANKEAYPHLQLNQDLLALLSQEGKLDPAWKEKIASAKQKVDILEQRQSTVLRIANYIVEKQNDFFVFGDIGLVPMLMKDCANELNLAESTISRAVNSKYLACPQGLFPLRYFFNMNVSGNEQGEGMSANAIKSIISQLIEYEDKKQPLSDSSLHELLQQQGIYIARRTVAKYREQLGIAAAQQRRQIPS